MGKSIIFWQSIISPHQVPYLKHLPKLDVNINYTLVVPEETQAVRSSLGWQKQKLDGFSIVVNPNDSTIKQLTQQENTIHIFEGIRGFPLGWEAFKLVSKTKNKIIILSEVPDLRGWKRNLIRRIASIAIERKYKKKIDLVFCIGEDAKNWYKWCGYKPEQLRSFSYVVEPSQKGQYLNETKDRTSIELVFIGSLIQLKGVDRLLTQLSLLKKPFHLTIIGEGILKKELNSLTIDLKIQDKVTFKGVVPNNKLRFELQKYDFLVLPSYYDGWGAVVNEALMEGIPVIVSSACGSADIVKYNSQAGFIFNSKKDETLLDCLLLADKNVKTFRKNQLELMKWADKKISGREVANYFYQNIESLFKESNHNTLSEISYKKQ